MGSLAGIQLCHGVASLPCLAPWRGQLGGRLSWTGDRVPAGGGLEGIGPLTGAQGSYQVFQRQEIEAAVSQGWRPGDSLWVTERLKGQRPQGHLGPTTRSRAHW